MRRSLIITLTVIIVIAAAIWWLYQSITTTLFAPTDQGGQTGVTLPTAPPSLPSVNSSATTPIRDSAPATNPPATEPVQIIAQNLTIPWAINWLPDGSLLVTERPGQLLLITKESQTVIPIQGVQHTGEGGLQGLAIHPQFQNNQFIYLYLTSAVGDGLINRVERYRLQGTRLTNRRVIIDNIPGARFHDGGRIAFGPDGLLYITTGDAGTPADAQLISSLAGKILRLNDDGTIPADNPFNSPIYSYGHRNPQGIAWDDQGRLWSTEHGRSGIRSGLDELNRITSGANYGWPDSQGDEVQQGTTAPALHSSPSITWAPAGVAFLNGSLFFTGLRGEALYQAPVTPQGGVGELVVHFHQQFGRLRDVKVGPDGFLYVTTSNQDGRGTPQTGDDKILKVDPSIFQ